MPMKSAIIMAILEKNSFCWVGNDTSYLFLYNLWLAYNS